ncbi:MAG: sortase [Clostridia bacterium]|nr:sortase [Clostridia bacterium]
MFKSKYGNLLTGLLIVVIVVIVGIIGYFGYKILTEDATKKKNEQVVEEFDQKYGKKSNNNGTSDGNITDIDAVEQTSSDDKIYMEGYEVVAKIRIPAISIEYPILNEVTKKSLDTAICLLYTVNGINQPGNTVYIGHNYRNSLFFSKNDQLENGDKVYIKDTTGQEIEYTIYNIFETTSTDTSFYQRDTQGLREITLSTCTDDASTTDKRLIIFARENN